MHFDSHLNKSIHRLKDEITFTTREDHAVQTLCQENESHHGITASRIARCWLGAGSPIFAWFNPELIGDTAEH